MNHRKTRRGADHFDEQNAASVAPVILAASKLQVGPGGKMITQGEKVAERRRG
jgi:hypothetical protein